MSERVVRRGTPCHVCACMYQLNDARHVVSNVYLNRSIEPDFSTDDAARADRWRTIRHLMQQCCMRNSGTRLIFRRQAKLSADDVSYICIWVILKGTRSRYGVISKTTTGKLQLAFEVARCDLNEQGEKQATNEKNKKTINC